VRNGPLPRDEWGGPLRLGPVASLLQPLSPLLFDVAPAGGPRTREKQRSRTREQTANSLAGLPGRAERAACWHTSACRPHICLALFVGSDLKNQQKPIFPTSPTSQLSFTNEPAQRLSLAENGLAKLPPTITLIVDKATFNKN